MMHKVFSLLVFIGLSIVILSACVETGNVEPPVATAIVDLPTQIEPTIEPTPLPTIEEVLPALSFSPATFRDEAARLEMDYPADWTVSAPQQIGDRGSQSALLSPGSTLETLAEGGSRIFFTTYVWDPKYDIEAFLQQRKIAWDASGFQIAWEKAFELKSGRKVFLFLIDIPESTRVLFAFTNSGKDYLQISGEGDIDLCEEIITTLRSIQ